jgi:hypothetical protein
MSVIVDLQAHRERRTPAPEPSRWWEEAAVCILENANPVLNKREKLFVADMSMLPTEPSPKQATWLDTLHRRAHAFLRGTKKMLEQQNQQQPGGG